MRKIAKQVALDALIEALDRLLRVASAPGYRPEEHAALFEMVTFLANRVRGSRRLTTRGKP